MLWTPYGWLVFAIQSGVERGFALSFNEKSTGTDAASGNPVKGRVRWL